VAAHKPVERAVEGPPELPALYALRDADCAQVAEVRGLDAAAVRYAAQTERVVAMVPCWPMKQDGAGGWRPANGSGGWRSWVAVDDTRRVAEYRRMDGKLYPLGADGIKAWSTRGKSWPVGADNMGQRANVLLVEGGPDMLAAWHFLLRAGLEEKVAVVCMLGASNKIAAEALPYFAGKRVRIVMDADFPKDSEAKAKRVLVAAGAALRWTAQLTAAGAACEVWNVGPVYDPDQVIEWHEGRRRAADVGIVVPGRLRRDGQVAKDLNDLALCGEEVTEGAEMRHCMGAWTF
jgi:hypothetical protein